MLLIKYMSHILLRVVVYTPEVHYYNNHTQNSSTTCPLIPAVTTILEVHAICIVRHDIIVVYCAHII